METGLFITLEGIEGSGKTTHAVQLAQRLRETGRSVLLTHEPGGTQAGEAIRAIFLNPAISLQVAAELLLVLADRAQHVVEKLKPALAAGTIVISDRYADSTTAYQGYGRGFDLKLLEDLNRLASAGLIPDLTIVLDCPVEVGMARIQQRNQQDFTQPDRFEGLALDFHHRIRSGFTALAALYPNRIRLIDSNRLPDLVLADISRLAEELITRRCR